jgi:hypothetical protein
LQNRRERERERSMKAELVQFRAITGKLNVERVKVFYENCGNNKLSCHVN